MKEMIKEMVEMTQENDRRKHKRMENLKAPCASPHQDMDQITLMGIVTAPAFLVYTSTHNASLDPY